MLFGFIGDCCGTVGAAGINDGLADPPGMAGAVGIFGIVGADGTTGIVGIDGNPGTIGSCLGTTSGTGFGLGSCIGCCLGNIAGAGLGIFYACGLGKKLDWGIVPEYILENIDGFN